MINGSVLAWAREEEGMSPGELADEIDVWVEDIIAWEAGNEYPRWAEMTRLAKALCRPSAIFYLPEAPVEASLPQSLRRAPGPDGRLLGRKELLQIRKALWLQKAASWVVRDSGSGPVETGPISRSRNPSRVGKERRAASGVATGEQMGWEDGYQGFRRWRSALEDKGILVFQMRLGRGGIRGFSIWDDYAPVAAVNTAYHPTARIFTLFHEVGHLLTRTDASCLGFYAPEDSGPGTESWCEQFAASFLIPADVLRSAVRQIQGSGKMGNPMTVRDLTDRFTVSPRAVAIRLQDIGLAEAGLYDAVASVPYQDWLDVTGGKGPNRVQRRIIEWGRLLPELLFSAADRGRLCEHDLTDYLRLTIGQVEDLRRELG